MSRHSKNNTAHSVFTYAEKKMLGSEYGTHKIRIGQDSQRNFEQCHLCLHTVVEPMMCGQGHIFCKNCILENLLTQKKGILFAIQQYEKRQKNDVLKEVLKKRKLDELEVQDFENDLTKFGALKKVKKYRKQYENELTKDNEGIEDDKKQAIILAITDTPTLEFDNHELKRKMIKQCFWMAESDGHRNAALAAAKAQFKEKKP